MVVTSPTGSGKSTCVPRWCPGRVLVVEPRRVACRALAQRVAELEGRKLGQEVGYQVRDERRFGPNTRIVFVTPGIALRLGDAALARFNTAILDELHERSLEVDLLLALLRQRFGGRLVAMSATIDGERVARFLGGEHLQSAGRLYPVEIHHLAGNALLPDSRGLEERLQAALAHSGQLAGDVLVFLPGKGEIENCAAILAGRAEIEVLKLHGGLSLAQQNRIFAPSAKRKVVLSTNVAETSITLPGTTVVIDSGLVRQTRYHRGRGFLTLVPIARDSAEQRAGRAGRTAPGVAYRLWDSAAQLEARTPPEIFRESLLPLVLGAAEWGVPADQLTMLDPPPSHALEAATEELRALQGLDSAGRITAVGHKLHGLPLDPSMGRWLVEAQRRDPEQQLGLLADTIDLTAALAVDRPLLRKLRPDPDADDPIERSPCDAVALIAALRCREYGALLCFPSSLNEAQRHRRRLRQVFAIEGPLTELAPKALDRQRLAAALLAADPRLAHLARVRGRRTGWSNGGTEIELGRDSRAKGAEGVEAILVLESRALGLAGKETRILASRAMPVPIRWLADAGLGRERLAEVSLKDHRVVTKIERVFARRTLGTREEVPQGALALQAMTQLYLSGKLFAAAAERSRQRLATARRGQLGAALRTGREHWREAVGEIFGKPVPELEPWVSERLAQLGVEHGEDLALLSPGDLLAPELPTWIHQEIERELPAEIQLPTARYGLDYDFPARQVTLRAVEGKPRQPPDPLYLPRLTGLAVLCLHRGSLLTLRS